MMSRALYTYSRQHERRHNTDMLRDCGLAPGSILHSLTAPWECARVLDGRHVDWRGKALTVSRAASLIGFEHGRFRFPVDGTKHWLYKGRRLSDLRAGGHPDRPKGLRVTLEYRHNMHGMAAPGFVMDAIAETLGTLSLQQARCKEPREAGRTFDGKQFSPGYINTHFKQALSRLGWESEFRVDEEVGSRVDFMKNGVLLEVQLGKYAFFDKDLNDMEMAIAQGNARIGVILIPTLDMLQHMATGPGNIEGYARRLHRMCALTPAKYPFPVLLLGIGCR